MKSFKKSRSVFIFVFFLSLFVCSRMFAENYPVENSDADICILAYDTKFKNMLTLALVEDLNAMEYSVTVDTPAHGKKYRAEDYDVVILLSGARFGRAMPEACEYIILNNYSANIIYFFTTTTSTNPYGKDLDNKKIDAITSASKSKNLAAMEKARKEIIEKTVSHMKTK